MRKDRSRKEAAGINDEEHPRGDLWSRLGQLDLSCSAGHMISVGQRVAEHILVQFF